MPEASDVAWVTSTFGRAHQRQLKAAAIINKTTTPPQRMWLGDPGR